MLDIKTQVSPSRLRSKQKVTKVLPIVAIITIALLIFASIILTPYIKNLSGSAGLASAPAAGGLADPTIKEEVWSSIVSYENTNNCSDPESVQIAVLQEPDTTGAWVEAWDVNACGVDHSYAVHYSSNPTAGVIFSITH